MMGHFSTPFAIEILEQRWAGENAESALYDICSHGRLRIIIGGQTISDDSNAELDYGINETTLALLRTLERDHSAQNSVAEIWPGQPRLVFHGCGSMPMLGCPIGMDWKVEHLTNERIRLSQVRRFDTTNENVFVSFPDLIAELDFNNYREIIVGFAAKAREFFAGIEKKIEADYEREVYQEFWDEFNLLMEKHYR